MASTTVNPYKIYLGTAEGNFKKWFYNRKTSFKNRKKANDTTLSSCEKAEGLVFNDPVWTQ